MVTGQSLGAQRLIVEECLKLVHITSAISKCADVCRWATQRIVFGKPLTAQPVIRAKLAAMMARVEAGQNWIESITYQMNHVSFISVSRALMDSSSLQMSYDEMSNKLAGPIGLMKQYVSDRSTH
jgi:alkylation response protein AidB-like acyl-CoA dehydrogenase